MSKVTASPMTDDGVEFASLSTDEEKFEFAQYVVNTPKDQRPEISPADARAALDWFADKS